MGRAPGRRLADGLDQTFHADAYCVPLARRAIVQLALDAGATGEQVDRIALAVSEAITNAVLHAYRERPGLVHIAATVVGDELTVLIADDGCGPHVPASTPGLGMGWALIADACDHFTIVERSGGGTEAQLRFTLD